MHRIALIAALVCAVSCKRSEDEAARARIFSPEQPVGELPEAKEQLQGGQLADDPALMRRVLHMQRREIDQRIGPHKAQQRVQFAWFRGPGLPDGGSEGRRVVRYAVIGFGARATEKETSDLPPVHYPENRTDPDTARRLELWEKEEPVSVRGTLVVDAETAAPLGCDLQGHFKVSGNNTQEPAAELHLHSVLVTTSIGRDPNLKAPQFEPETSVPHAVKDPLRFLGKGPAAGPQPPAGEEPDESEEEEPAPR